ncbi:hypothetical protein TNCT_676641 [Trichonephila clavata]|uniref:Uncharacterized protein n=1 Tax=Trichonephila clavata TaxID=2740835 RepID=A0A8X6KQZ8_TRICU|nr:hypothetical protein TNCT_676641 [Trichonephila clavata]
MAENNGRGERVHGCVPRNRKRICKEIHRDPSNFKGVAQEDKHLKIRTEVARTASPFTPCGCFENGKASYEAGSSLTD